MAGVGTLLRRYREAAGLSQEELAERARLSARGVSDLERGLRRNPYPATIRRLALALGLTPEDRATLLTAAHAPPRDEAPHARPVVEHGAYLGARAAFGLVGRERELSEVHDALDQALAGRGRLLLLSGEAGIGKTRLAQELATLADARGYMLATGRCYEPHQGVAFYPFLDALASLYARAPAAVREGAAERWPYLQRLLPDVFPGSTGTTPAGPDELERLLRAASGFVRACAATTPVALLIDDLQWADRASVELVQHLVRHTRGEHVLIGGTVREPELGSAASLRRALVDLQREGLLQRARLERLDRMQTAALLADRLGGGELAPELIEAIHAASGGNPFFAIELLQTLRARGELARVGQLWSSQRPDCVAVPDSVRESILERFARLSASSAAAVEAATVLGHTFVVDELAGLLEIDAEAVEGALEEAVSIGFIRPPGTFVHALTHQALYENVPGQRRRRLHLRAATVFEQLPVARRARRAAELARHLQLANEPGRALPYLLLAGDEAEAVFAHHEAAQHYQAAVRVAAEIGERTAEARACVGLGGSWLAAGRPGRALEHFEAAVRIYHALDDPEGEGETLARIAQVYFARGSWDAGLERLPALIERLESRPPSRALVLLYACLAMVMPAEPATRLRAATRASELARVLGDDDLRVQAEARRGFVLMLAGRLPEARGALEAVLPLAEARRVYDALPIVVGVLSEVTKLQGDLCGYLRLAQRGVARAEAAGDLVSLVGALSGVAEAEFLSGDWSAARRTYARASREGSGLDAAWYQAFVQLGLAAIDLAEGNWNAVERQLAECLVDSPRLGHHNRREHAQRLLARRDLLAGEPSAALARLQEVVRSEGDEHPGTQALRAWALLESGESALAAHTVVRAIDLATQQGNQLDLCEALLVGAEVERHAGDFERAGRTLAQGLALAHGMPWPYAEGRLRYARAELLADLGEVGDGMNELQVAIRIFTRLGAGPYLARAERLRARLSLGSS